MKAFSQHLLFELKSGLRDKTLLLMNYLFPIGFYIIIGTIMPKLNPLYGELLIPSMMMFSILVSTVLGMPNNLVTYRNNGIFRSYKINGVSKLSMLAIPAISTIIHTLIVTTIILVSSPILFKAELPSNILGLILVFVASTITFVGLALLIGVIADNTSTTVIYAQALFLPSMLIGGLMFPSNLLPGSIEVFSKLLPTTYAMNAYKALTTNNATSMNPMISLGILFSSGIISLYLSWYLFRLDNNDILKSKNKILAIGALVPFILGAIFI